ncbi:MAG: AbiV family abortive infection protein, partial [Bacteroidetes bacterium]|nr:AbiV family abortive infection protein [Bacteroidota bacterium]
MKITKEILIDAAKKSLENAKELVVDAIILEKNNRKERAYTLFQFSIEEVGKAISSTLMIFTKGYNDVDRTKEYVRFFKDHKFKT